MHSAQKNTFCYTQTIGFANGVGVDKPHMDHTLLPTASPGALPEKQAITMLFTTKVLPPLSYSTPSFETLKPLRWGRGRVVACGAGSSEAGAEGTSREMRGGVCACRKSDACRLRGVVVKLMSGTSWCQNLRSLNVIIPNDDC